MKATPASPLCGLYKAAVLALVLPLVAPETVPASDQSSTYEWKPVRIGAGGWVDGFVTHPLNPDVRYVRTDVGNAYRWDTALQEWMPMVVHHETGTSRGIPLADALEPNKLSMGIFSIAVDSQNTNTVYAMLRLDTLPASVNKIELRTQLFKSTDGGRNFVRIGNLGLPGDPNEGTDSHFRRRGERLQIDPQNPGVLYYGHYEAGLMRSTDGGATWTAALPARNATNIIFDPSRGSVSAHGVTVTRRIYVLSRQHAQSVLMSDDGGVNWVNITPAGLVNTVDGAGKWTNQTGQGTLAPNGDLWVTDLVKTNNTHQVWCYTASSTSPSWVERATPAAFINVAFSPTLPGRMFGLEDQLHLYRSTDNGVTWSRIVRQTGKRNYLNTFAWMPDPGTGGHSCSRMEFDSNGVGWIPNGNYGVLRFQPSTNNSESANNPIGLTIDSKGIEELVGTGVTIPPGGNGSAFIACMDEGGFFVSNPDTFTAIRQKLSVPNGDLTAGLGIAYASDRPNKMVLGSSNYFLNRRNYSGISSDFGRNWSPLRAVPGGNWPTFNLKDDIWQPVQTGEVAISSGSLGSAWTGTENIVYQPTDNLVPLYSKDGGRSFQWSNVPGAVNNRWPENRKPGTVPWQSTWSLQADPHVSGKFYIQAGGRLFVSTDGGENWVEQPGLTINTQQVVVANRAVPNQLWMTGSAWEANKPLRRLDWNPATGAWTNTTFTTFKRTQQLAIGASRGQTGDFPYTLYVYGVLASDTTNRWGIFRSMDGGGNWERISYYPAGMIEDLRALTASWDEFGLLYFTMAGNTAGYGRPSAVPPTNGAPRPPSALTALSLNGRVMLEWSTVPGATSYTLLGAATSGGPYTVIASNLSTSRWLQSGLVNGTTQYYVVRAVNSAGASHNSHQVDATPLTGTPAASGLTHANIGADGGVLHTQGNTVFLSSAGADIWGSADQFSFASKSFSGDAEISARVTHIDATSTSAKAGLMFRESASPGSRNVLLAATPGSGVVMQARSATNGATTNVAPAKPVSAFPVQLRLVRQGNQFTGWYKPSITEPWTVVGTVTIALPPALSGGLAHTSRFANRFGTAAFDEINRNFNVSNILVEEREFPVTVPAATFVSDASPIDVWVGGTGVATGGKPGRFLQNNPWNHAAWFARRWGGLSGAKHWTFAFDLKFEVGTLNGHPAGGAVFGLAPGATLTSDQIKDFLNSGVTPPGVTALTSRNLSTRLVNTQGWLSFREEFTADLSIFNEVVIGLYSNADDPATAVRAFDNVLLYNDEGPEPGVLQVVNEGQFSAPLSPASYTAGTSTRKRWIGGTTASTGGDPDAFLQNGAWNYASWYGFPGSDVTGSRTYFFSCAIRVNAWTHYNMPVGVAILGLSPGVTVTADQLKLFLHNGTIPSGTTPISSRNMRVYSSQTNGWIYFNETFTSDLSQFSDVVIGFYSNTDNPAGAIRGLDNVLLTTE